MLKLIDENIMYSQFYAKKRVDMFRVCHAVLSVHCSLVDTCWERADLLALFCVIFSSVFVSFPSGVVLDCIDSWSLPS